MVYQDDFTKFIQFRPLKIKREKVFAKYIINIFSNFLIVNDITIWQRPRVYKSHNRWFKRNLGYIKNNSCIFALQSITIHKKCWKGKPRHSNNANNVHITTNCYFWSKRLKFANWWIPELITTAFKDFRRIFGNDKKIVLSL